MDSYPLFTVPTVPIVGGSRKWLYLLHFDEKRAHAQHYLGSSEALMARLEAHATGRGACLTRALWVDSQGWRLAAVFVPRDPNDSIRCLERRAKQRKQTSDFCPLCTRNNLSPRGTVQYPTPDVTSRDFLKGMEPSK